MNWFTKTLSIGIFVGILLIGLSCKGKKDTSVVIQDAQNPPTGKVSPATPSAVTDPTPAPSLHKKAQKKAKKKLKTKEETKKTKAKGKKPSKKAAKAKKKKKVRKN